MKDIFICVILIFLFSCNQNNQKKSAIIKDNKFENYISLKDKIFKDGGIDFYPMVMNYSVDILTIENSIDTIVYATPKSKYHPFYGKNEGEHLNPWGNDSSKTHLIIKNHFQTIKKMGFNAIRLTGFTATDFFDNGFHTWSKIDISNTPKGNKNINDHIIPLLKQIITYAENAGLRTILLISAVETQPKNQHNYYKKIAEGLVDQKGLFAYDVYNEPIYFDRGDYSKAETKAFVKNYNNIIKLAAPKHLTTIGLTHYKIVYEWDPELMDVDFLSFHAYPYWSKNLSLLERFESKLYWISKNITKPWIVGETGLNTVTKCDPMNLSSGTKKNQLKFMKYSLKKFRSAGASGYSWWNYQDSRIRLDGECPHWDRYGLIESKKEGNYSDGHIGKMKHAIKKLPFLKFLNNSPYKTEKHKNIPMPPKKHYYNIDYLPNHKNALGKVLDQNGNPIRDAIITLKNTISNTQYSTFSKPDGTFDLKTGWTNIFLFCSPSYKDLEFKLRVTAVKKKTVNIPLSHIYSGKENLLQDVILYDFQ